MIISLFLFVAFTSFIIDCINLDFDNGVDLSLCLSDLECIVGEDLLDLENEVIELNVEKTFIL
jgi:hypothetical protein